MNESLENYEKLEQFEETRKSKNAAGVTRNAIFGDYDDSILSKIKDQLPNHREKFTVKKFIEIYNTLDETSKSQIKEVIARSYQQISSKNTGFADITAAAVYGLDGAALTLKIGADFPELMDDRFKLVEKLFGLKEGPSKERQERALTYIWDKCQELHD